MVSASVVVAEDAERSQLKQGRVDEPAVCTSIVVPSAGDQQSQGYLQGEKSPGPSQTRGFSSLHSGKLRLYSGKLIPGVLLETEDSDNSP